MSKYKNLFSPFRLGTNVIKNRIIMPAMDTSLCDADGNVTPALRSYYARRALGGAGMIIMEFTSVDSPSGLGGNTQLRINNPQGIPAFREISDIVHAYGTKILVQLHHAGMRSVVRPGVALVGPCDAIVGNNSVQGLTIDEIKELTGKYVSAARNAQMANMDGIEIHAGHGYLLGQFLSPETNTRVDIYGNDTKGRCRFLVEIIQAIRKACGPQFIISTRLTVMDWDPRGLQLEEGIEIAKIIDQEDLNLINITTGIKYKYNGASETNEKPDGNRLPLAIAVKPHVKTPVAIVGKLRTGEMCEQIIAHGTADFVCVGRQLICDPDWPNKLRLGKENEIRKCLNCLEGCYAAISEKRGIRCSINPTVGFESIYDEGSYPQVAKPRHVVVIGSGITGMQSAITASQRGNKVTLIEKQNKLGGQMYLASVPPHKELVAEAIDYFEQAIAREDIIVMLNTEATAKFVQSLRPDTVILATGSKPFVPSIPGIERAVECWDILSSKRPPSDKNINIIGGGNVGCETALHLLKYNNKLTIIEMLPTLSNGQEATHRMRDLEELEKGGVKTYVSANVLNINEKGVNFSDKDGNKQFSEDDLLITATGQRPVGEDLYNALDSLGIRVERAGDAIAMGNFRVNVLSGFLNGYYA